MIKPNNSPNLNSIALLDGLRGIATIWVCLYHFWQMSWLNHELDLGFISFNLNLLAQSGFLAVEVFFFLSGFCLFLPYAKSMINGDKIVSTKRFYYKRAIKILPSYILCVFVLFFCKGVYELGLQESIYAIGSNLLFLTNISKEYNVINGVFWTLCVEVQFYLLFPLIAYYFKKQPYFACFVMCIIAIIYRLGSLHFNPHGAVHYNEQLLSTFDLFACGMLSSYVVVKLRNQASLLAFSSTLFTLISFFTFLLAVEFISWYNLTRLYGGNPDIWQLVHRITISVLMMLFTIAGIFSTPWWQKIFANRVLIFFSVISYNLYLWHQVIAVYLYENNILPAATENLRADINWQINYNILVWVASIAIASLITYGFERPIMKNGIRGSLQLIKNKLFLSKGSFSLFNHSAQR